MLDLSNTVLGNIVAARRMRLEEARACVSLEQMKRSAEARTERREFVAALAPGVAGGSPGLRVIAELKRASPSRGLLRQDYRRRDIAQGYEAAGAAALSVLTEEQFFLGSLDDLQEVRGAVTLPVLRKDFILDDYQVYESVAASADALLLIVAVLADKELRNLIQLCQNLRIAALVEVHTQEELDRALAAGARVVGINNRDLKTLEVNLETSFRLREKIPANCIAVSESGIQTARDVRNLAQAGFHAILVGERLMISPDPGKELAALLGGGSTLAARTSQEAESPRS
jgi:indole-3-glycerol phosphate synthase